jgi:hypothetical protein
VNIISDTGSGPNNQDTSVRTLAELEFIVEKGKATFLEVAAALVEIRLRKLYKPKGWIEYLKERFGFSRQHAHRIMQAKALADASPVGDKPRTEREARKRLSEKRSNRKQPVKPIQPSIVIEDLDLDVEFTAIKERVELWVAEFAPVDYLRLVANVKDYLEAFLASAGYSNHIVIKQPEVEEVIS